MSYIPKIERSSLSKLHQFQSEKLLELLAYIEQKSLFYQRLFQKKKNTISQIKSITDLSSLPFTTKDDLHHFNDDFLCVKKEKVVDWVTTSGTLGHPVTFAATEKDLERLAYNEYLSFTSAGSTHADTYQLMVTLDKRFIAGMAYYVGLRKLGAGIVRVGNGSPGLQLDSIQRFQPTGLVAVPSFLVKLAEYADNQGINLSELSVNHAICIGEPIRKANFELNALGQKIKDTWGIKLFSTYASTEMSTAFTECSAGRGGHLHPELIIVEVLDENDRPVKNGAAGELVITTLGMEAMPLLRFRTGDICSIYEEACSCGRTSPRLGPIIGRKQQMIKLKGTTLYPPAIFEVLNDFALVDDFIIEFFKNELELDAVLVKIAGQHLNELAIEELKDRFRMQLRVVPLIEICSKKEIMKLKFPKMARKPRKLIDRR